MKKLKFIDKIEIKSPCQEEWNDMIGNDKVRFCSHCVKDVNNISEMTRKEAVRLVRKHDGHLCVRYRIDPVTKRPIFLDTLHKISRRVPAIAVTAVAVSITAGSAYAQGEPVPAPQDTTQNAPKSGDETSTVSGYVTDSNGASIPYAVVDLVNEKTNQFRAVSASFEGFYEFADVPAGEYTLKFEGGGFAAKEFKGIAVAGGGTMRRDAVLAIQDVSEVVTVTADVDIRTTVDGGVMISIESFVPLVGAVQRDDLEEVKARVMMRAKVNARDKGQDGITALHAAVENGNIEIIQFLLDSGAKTNIRDFQKRTPLMMMDSDATAEIFDLLIRYGAKVQLVDSEKNTVLHHFVENADDENIVRLLVSHGINVDAINKSGETALMIAAENGNPADVKALLESGADVSKLNRDSKTAWDLTDDGEIQSLLESYGAVAWTIQ
jgi:hypothetical protein